MSTLISVLFVSENGQPILETNGCKSVIGVDNLEIGCPFLLIVRRISMSKKTNTNNVTLEWITAFVFIILVSWIMIQLSPNFSIVYIVFGLLFGAICAGMAGNRGRSGASGLVSGFLFGFLGVIYYLIAGDTVELRVKKEEDARRKYRAELRNKDEDDL